jgi:cytochrome d ubiquinol oxidase subunit I
MTALASTTVDLARIQFATTSIYHFLFVPLTLGLGPLVAIMQTGIGPGTRHYRGGCRRFFGTLLQSTSRSSRPGSPGFEFRMNWSVYSEIRRQRLRAPLAIEGRGVHARVDVPGLWIFGWNRLSAAPRHALIAARHLARATSSRRGTVDAAPGRALS